MSGNVLIIDSVSPKPYSAVSLDHEPLGGTEATVLRVAKALSAEYDITIAQASRDQSERDKYGIGYIPYTYKDEKAVAGSPDHIIVIRAYKIIPRLRKQFPDSRMFLWMHCFPGKHCKRLNEIAVKAEATLLTVSDFHRQNVMGFMRKYARKNRSSSRLANVLRVYNPIDNDLMPDSSPVDKNKLVYFSSPHKGLGQVLDTFAYARRINPDLRLYVANPGYMWMKSLGDPQGVINLGALPHREVIRHVREAFCVFYPQTNFRETFGLVFAEANAVGTPVLAHPIGSTKEVLGDTGQIMDCLNKKSVFKKMVSWQVNGRPQVKAREQFRCSEVTRHWKALLNGQNERTHQGQASTHSGMLRSYEELG